MICYHGTSEENAKSIRSQGFKKGTYFAYKRQDALKFGGPIVFAVEFSSDPAMWHGVADGWQFHVTQVISPKFIRRVYE